MRALYIVSDCILIQGLDFALPAMLARFDAFAERPRGIRCIRLDALKPVLIVNVLRLLSGSAIDLGLFGFLQQFNESLSRFDFGSTAAVSFFSIGL
ncbi:hypothetical protein QZH47_31190 (plasmid) [Pseudomonas corrugata]